MTAGERAGGERAGGERAAVEPQVGKPEAGEPQVGGADPRSLVERRKTRRVRRAAGAAVALALVFAGAATVASARGDEDGPAAGGGPA
ncbi:DUF305 domain-containing protein, partial [Streptomyces sp. SID724]|nr:DUF305 domain-containing protein [Streptomyces sp. SID724]